MQTREQKRTGDMKIKNNLTGTKGEEDNRGKKSNMYNGPIDKDNRERTVFVRRGWTVQGEQPGDKWGQP